MPLLYGEFSAALMLSLAIRWYKRRKLSTTERQVSTKRAKSVLRSAPSKYHSAPTWYQTSPIEA
eukprot:3189883-Rhodomonas_salina.2